MRKIIFLLLFISSVSFGQDFFLPMLWKLNGTSLEPTNSIWKIPAANLNINMTSGSGYILTSNLSINSNTPTNVTGLVAPVTTGKKYFISGYIRINTGTNPSYTRLLVPANTYISGITLILRSSSSNVTAIDRTRAILTNTALVDQSATYNAFGYFNYFIEVGTSGNISIQFWNDGGYNSQLSTGTFFKIEEVQ